MENLETVFQELADELRAEIERFRDRLPPGAEGLADKLQSIIMEKVGSLSPAMLKAALLADLLTLFATQKGPAPHDPTELV